MTNVSVSVNSVQDAAGNGNIVSNTYSITYNLPSTTVTSVTRITPSPTATATVSYRVVFAANVTGVSTGNFSVTSTTGATIASDGVSGSGTTYTVIVNTGTGNGTLTLNVQNSTGISPTVTNVPYTSGEQYSIIKSFAAAPQLSLRGAGSAGGTNADVTVFVDTVRVVQNGTSTAVANALQNRSFESSNVPAGGYYYASGTPAVVAAPWAFGLQAGVSRNNSAFGSTASYGDAVAFLQTISSVAQNLAVPTGSYQVNFVAIQRSNNGPSDQVVNAFLVEGSNTVFIGSFQPTSNSTYQPFTSAAFSVTAPALTATVSSSAANSGSSTSTTPIPFSVSFSQSVGTTFTEGDVAVTNGSITTGSFAGSGSGPYAFTVTPTTPGTATSVSLAAGVANDGNNTLNQVSNTYSITFAQTPAPVVVAPTNGSTTTNTTPAYTGTAPANSTVTVYVNSTSIGTTTADAGGNWTRTQPTALTSGTYSVFATAKTSSAAVSANSNTNTFTVTSPATYTSSTADQPNTSRVAAGSTNQESCA